MDRTDTPADRIRSHCAVCTLDIYGLQMSSAYFFRNAGIEVSFSEAASLAVSAWWLISQMSCITEFMERPVCPQRACEALAILHVLTDETDAVEAV